MTIHLPENLERPILAAVHRGRYASLDDAMTEAASLLVQRLKQEQAEAKQPVANQAETAPDRKPIWERILERSAAIPDEEWDKLPTDLAEQHDHYLYGTPKRPSSP
jgi:Arc/MetJ-type ribon-helix-helix transcriptional regulator